MRTLSLLAVALLAAGCLGLAGPDDAPTPATTPAPGSPGAPTAPTAGGGGAPPTTSAPAGGSGGANDTAEGNASAGPRTVTLEGTASFTAGVGTPCLDSAQGCAVGFSLSFAPLPIEDAAPRKATLVATWTPVQPLAATLVVRLHPAEGAALASAKGTSPLTLEIPPEALASPGEYLAAAFPDTPGLMLDQNVDVVLTLEYA